MTVGSKHVLNFVAVAAFCGLVAPATASAQDQPRVFGGVSFGAPAVAESSFTQSVVDLPYRGELFNQRADYKVPAGFAFDMNAGWMFTKEFGASLGYSRFGSSDTASFFIDVPSPFVNNDNASATATTGKLRHTQQALHLMGVYKLQLNSDLDIKLFAGPSRIYVRQELVDDVEVSESTSPAHSVRITDFFISNPDECVCKWGFNVGADVAKYFTQRLGVGGMFRYSRATVEMKNAFASTVEGAMVTQKYTAGGFMIGGGLRVKF